LKGYTHKCATSTAHWDKSKEEVQVTSANFCLAGDYICFERFYILLLFTHLITQCKMFADKKASQAIQIPSILSRKFLHLTSDVIIWGEARIVSMLVNMSSSLRSSPMHNTKFGPFPPPCGCCCCCPGPCWLVLGPSSAIAVEDGTNPCGLPAAPASPTFLRRAAVAAAAAAPLPV